MSIRILAISLLLALAPSPGQRAIAAERPLTLDEAITFALEKNEGILIGREALVAAEAAVTGANGAYDPLLELDGGWRRVTDPLNSAFFQDAEEPDFPTIEAAEAGLSVSQLIPSGGAVSLRARAARETTDGSSALLSPAYGTQVGVELRQPLLRDRAVDPARLARKVAASDREGARAALRSAVSETIAAVEQAYWSLVFIRLEVDVREEAVRLAEEQLAETRTRIESGTAPETELAQPRAELERRRGELLASTEAASRAQNSFKVLILSDADDALWLEDFAPVEEVSTEVVPVEVAASLERALADRPELDVVEAVVARRRAETAFSRNRVWPALDAVLSYDRFGLAGTRIPIGSTLPGSRETFPAGTEGKWGDSFQTLGDGDFDAARIGLVFGIPLGNRTARADATTARTVERRAEADLDRARKAVRTEVLDAAAALQTAGQRIEAARAGREAAEIQLSAEEDRYAAGLSTNFLVLTRQNDLSRARLDEISALTDYRTARTEMARATGSLIEERGIDVNGMTP